MALGDLSDDDLYRVNSSGSQSEFKDSFDNEVIDDIGDLESLFGGGSNDFGSDNSDSDLDGLFGGGVNSGEQSSGSSNLNLNGFNQGFNATVQNGNNQMTFKKSAMDDFNDKVSKEAAAVADSAYEVLKDLARSIKTRTYTEIGYFSRNLIIVGAVMSVISLIFGILASVLRIKALGLEGFCGQSIISGIIMSGIGIIGIAVSAIIIDNIGERQQANIEDIQDSSNITNEIEDELDDEFLDMFGDDLDEVIDDYETPSKESDDKDVLASMFGNAVVSTNNSNDKINSDEVISNITENDVITRTRLIDIFVPLLPVINPDFSDRSDIDEDSSTGLSIKTACIKSAANVMKCEIEDINTSFKSMIETKFSYEIYMKRVKGLTKTAELEREIEVYFRNDSKDTAVNATVDIEGDYYKIVVTKGKIPMVSVGDAFKLSNVRDFFSNTDNMLPLFLGVNELGQIEMEDAKVFDTMLIAGKPRSGKSWYTLMILMCLAMFNSPEDIQMLIIDPKSTHLFKTFSLLPHVFGLHDGDYILQLLDEIINIEAPRRKALIDKVGADDIWALRKKGVRLPVLYIVIDEYLTIATKLGQDVTELNSRMRTIISQFPSLGIRMIFVPHRATGVVDKTNRTMIQFTAAVRLNSTDVMDTLDVKKWNRPLVNVGDIAIRSSSMEDAEYVRGLAVTKDDDGNNELIKTVAKAFYKMGAEFEDMSYLTMCYNRNIDYIKSALSNSGTEKVQFNESNIFNGM